MPIYEYACPDCGYTHDHLQKMADAPIAACPKCASTKYYKKISAAGFALKGTGWYVTDFRAGGDGANSGVGASPAPAADTGSSAATPAAAPAAAAPAPAATPAPAPAPATAKPASKSESSL